MHTEGVRRKLGMWGGLAGSYTKAEAAGFRDHGDTLESVHSKQAMSPPDPQFCLVSRAAKVTARSDLSRPYGAHPPISLFSPLPRIAAHGGSAKYWRAPWGRNRALPPLLSNHFTKPRLCFLMCKMRRKAVLSPLGLLG